MKHICKVLFLSMAFITVVSIAHAEKRIKLKLRDGQLEVDEPSQAWKDDNVVWEIQGSGIRSFRIKDSISVSNVYYPFTQPLPMDQRQVVSMVVRNTPEPVRVDWYYEIEWIDAYGVVHLLDPKIPVKPAVTIGLKELVAALAFILTIGLSLNYRKKWLGAAKNNTVK